MTSDPFRLVKAYFSPKKDAEENVVGFLDRLAHTADIAMFSLTNTKIAAALQKAVERKVKVRILGDAEQAKIPQSLFGSLVKAGIEFRPDTEYGYMHNKFVIGDYGKKGMAVLTGSFNWTERAQKVNRENFVRIRIKAVIGQYHTEFEEIWTKNAPKPPT